MRAGWTVSGACTSGSTARPRVATRRASGGAATTSTATLDRYADARTGMARRGGGVPLLVGRDGGGDDAALPGPDAGALPAGLARTDDLARGPGVFRLSGR